VKIENGLNRALEVISERRKGRAEGNFQACPMLRRQEVNEESERVFSLSLGDLTALQS
jgi:hypothetical protein